VPSQQWLFLYLNAVLERLQPFMSVNSKGNSSETSTSTAAAAPAKTHESLPDLLLQIAYTLAYMNILPLPAWRAQLFLVVTGQLPHFSPDQAVHMLHAMALWRMGANAQRFSAAGDSAAAAPAAVGVDYPAPLVDALAVLAGGPAGMRDLKPGARRNLPQCLKALGWPGDQELVESNLSFIQGAMAHLQVCMVGSSVCCGWLDAGYRVVYGGVRIVDMWVVCVLGGEWVGGADGSGNGSGSGGGMCRGELGCIELHQSSENGFHSKPHK
jgi:hypothetical protein